MPKLIESLTAVEKAIEDSAKQLSEVHVQSANKQMQGQSLTQQELSLLSETGKKLGAVSKLFSDMEKQYQTRAEALQKAGDPIAEDGEWKADLKAVARRCISWKKQFEAKVGVTEAKRVVAEHKPKEKLQLRIWKD